MLQVVDPIAAPLQHFDFDIKAFDKTTICPADEVVGDLFPPVCQGLQEIVKALQATCLDPFDPAPTSVTCNPSQGALNGYDPCSLISVFSTRTSGIPSRTVTWSWLSSPFPILLAMRSCLLFYPFSPSWIPPYLAGTTANSQRAHHFSSFGTKRQDQMPKYLPSRKSKVSI